MRIFSRQGRKNGLSVSCPRSIASNLARDAARISSKIGMSFSLSGFAHEVARARETGRARGPLDRYAWTLSFKSVLLEGLEVVFIVLTLGVNQGSIPLAAMGAVVAAVVVGAAAVLARRPLSRVPENALKFGVGVMLTAFGTFWAAEGAGAEWPGGDAALLGNVGNGQ